MRPNPPDRPPANRLARLVTLLCLVTGVVVALVVARTQTFSDTGLLDLRIYVASASSLRHGGSIYDFHDAVYTLGSTYPPFASVVFLPLTFVDLHVVEQAVSVANALLWFGLLHLLQRRSPRFASYRSPWSTPATAGIALATLPSVAVWNTINQGQVNLVLWVLLVIDLALVLRGHPAAGVLTGVAGAIKLVPLLVLVLVGLTGRVRYAVTGAVAFAGCAAVGWLVAPSDSRRYWQDLLWDTSRVGAVDGAQNNSVQAVLARVGLEGSARSIVWAGVVAVVVVLAVLGLRRALAERAIVTAATIAGCAMALVSPISWMHHLVFLAFPLLLLLPRAPLPRAALAGRAAAVVGLSVLLADPLGSNGRHALTASLRTGVMLAFLLLAPRAVDAERSPTTWPARPGGLPEVSARPPTAAGGRSPRRGRRTAPG